MSPNHERELTEKYTALHVLVDKIGKTLLEMMRHPDATAEQLDEARLKYFVAYKVWIETRRKLRNMYPPNPGRGMWQKELPWNGPQT